MFLQQLINGLALGSTYALVALGYSLVFGVLKIINFANGSLYMLGAYLTLTVSLAMNGHVVLAFLISVICTGIAGFLVDFISLRKLRKNNAPRLSGLIATLGMATIIENVIQIWFGTETKRFPALMNLGKIHVGKAIISSAQILMFVVCIVVMLVFSFIVYKTKVGKSMRAVSQNMVTARLMGINVRLIISATFFAGGFMAAVAGTLVGAYYHCVDTTMAASVGLKTFSAAVLGGVGNLPGACIGGFIIGVAETMGATYISSTFRDGIPFIILIAVLLFKPTGIFGKKTVEKM